MVTEALTENAAEAWAPTIDVEAYLERCSDMAPQSTDEQIRDLWNAIIRLTARVAELEMQK